MTYSQLLTLLKKTNLSAEQLAPYFSASNMTLRRWKIKKNKAIEDVNLNNIYQGIYRLISDGYLSSDSLDVQNFIQKDSHNYIQSVMKSLGIDSNLMEPSDKPNNILNALHKIGAVEGRTNLVDTKLEEIQNHEDQGLDWKSKLSLLLKVIRSKDFLAADKIVAYGALFYLITPFDFIPDHIPIIGFLDDFAVIGIAVVFYQTKFSQKLKKL